MALDWSYDGTNGPENWHKICAAASGNCQSPIDIRTDKKICSCSLNKTLKMMYLPNEMNVLTNTGHSWNVEGAANNGSYITGGPLTADYSLVQIHAHWGGSEHSFNGEYQAGELHMVHQNKLYPTMDEAKNHPDGLCVIATLLKIGKPHSEIQKIVNKLSEIVHKGDKTTLDEFVNPKLFLPSNLGYWTYMGSLTTPPCNECVVWVVFDNPIEVSTEQLQAFRDLRCHRKDETEHECLELTCEDKMIKNCRPAFNLGNRIMRRASTTNAICVDEK